MLNRSKERRVRDTHPSPFRWLYFWWQFLTESCLEPFESQLWYLTCWLPYALCHIIQFHADVSDTLESLRDQQYLHVGNWALNSLAIKEQWFHTAPEEWFRRPDTKYMLWDDSWRNPLTVLGSTHCVNQGQCSILQDALCYFIHPRVSETFSNMLQSLHIFGRAAGGQVGTGGTSQMVLHTDGWAAAMSSYQRITEYFSWKGP